MTLLFQTAGRTTQAQDRAVGLHEVVGIINRRCRALQPAGAAAIAAQINRLLEAGAWSDAALALIKLEAPEWTVRRLELDDGEWFCALSRHPTMPAIFDDMVEAHDRLMPAAIVAALAEARAIDDAEAVGRRRSPRRD